MPTNIEQDNAIDGGDFEQINRGFNKVFKSNRLSIGLVVPIENYSRSVVPDMSGHLERVQLAESLGFSAIWLRDVPFNLPTFGDAGQTYDPFVYLGYLAAQTENIALGVSSIILPLRHPAHLAKAAASVDVLSEGRLILGVASGDRPEEYPAMNIPFDDRGARFRDCYDYIRRMSDSMPQFDSTFGSLRGNMDMLPKPVATKLPLLITGGSQQHPDWSAEHADGWMTYPRNAVDQHRVVQDWKERARTITGQAKPVMQPLYVDLADSASAPPQPIHLGFRSGIEYIKSYARSLVGAGVNHLALNLRFNQSDINETMTVLSEELLPEFHT